MEAINKAKEIATFLMAKPLEYRIEFLNYLKSSTVKETEETLQKNELWMQEQQNLLKKLQQL